MIRQQRFRNHEIELSEDAKAAVRQIVQNKGVAFVGQQADTYALWDISSSRILPLSYPTLNRDGYFPLQESWSSSCFSSGDEWRQVSSAIERARQSAADFLPISNVTYQIAEAIVNYVRRQNTPPPNVTPDGEGSIFLEWESNNKHLSICVAEGLAGSYIYTSEGGAYQALPLTYDNLESSLAKLNP